MHLLTLSINLMWLCWIKLVITFKNISTQTFKQFCKLKNNTVHSLILILKLGEFGVCNTITYNMKNASN